VREVAAGNYAARSGVGRGKSELDELARSFDQMAEALEKRERERDEAEELRLRVRLAEESEQAKSEVLRTVSHELRTPLTTVRGFASLLSEYWDSLGADERAAYLGDIEDAAVRMEKLVADLLTLSRIEAKALNLDLQPVSVREMFEAARRAAKVIEPRARVKISVSPGAETVRADWTSAQEVLLNLLENSLKYGNPRAPIELTAEPNGAAMVRISVRDHGPGVSHEDLATLFEPFFRSREAQVRARGTGLGLPICKGLVEAHGGEISVNLPPDGGLEVNFTLPVAR
jgi:two-component system sensor histidine kinase KdpD